MDCHWCGSNYFRTGAKQYFKNRRPGGTGYDRFCYWFYCQYHSGSDFYFRTEAGRSRSSHCNRAGKCHCRYLLFLCGYEEGKAVVCIPRGYQNFRKNGRRYFCHWHSGLNHKSDAEFYDDDDQPFSACLWNG